MDLMGIRNYEICRVVNVLCVEIIAEIAAKEYKVFREMVGAWLLLHLLPQKLL